MDGLNLYMLLCGCKPAGRFTEQHDVFFGIGNSLKELVPQINLFWPEAKKNIHIDAWRKVTVVDGFTITIKPSTSLQEEDLSKNKLFFLNLGGYKKNEFEEFHYKMLCVAEEKEHAIKTAKKELFYKHTGFKGASSHIDDTYGLDVDEVYSVEEILNPAFTEKYIIVITEGDGKVDEIHLGYLPLWKIPVSDLHTK